MKRNLKRPDWEELQQIPLGLQIEEEESGGSISPEDARRISEAAREALNMQGEKPEWFLRYEELRGAGWPWRVACYIAWASSPRNNRQPATQELLAIQTLGLKSDKQIWAWRKKNPAIDETVALLQAAPLFEHRSDIFDALIKSATSPDYKSHQDRKIALEMLGDYVPRAKVEVERHTVEDLEQLSDAELERIARLGRSDSQDEGEEA